MQNSRRATLAQQAYCTANPGGFMGYGGELWGITACDGPKGYGARGAPPAFNDDGTLAPTAVATVGTPLEGKTVAEIATGHQHTCARTTDDVTACWGTNGNGQLGDATTTTSSLPGGATLPDAPDAPTVIAGDSCAR